MKIGEIVSASVLGGLYAKLQLENPEDLRIAYPVIVEGKTYDFYCMVEDILNEESEIAEQLAGSAMGNVIVPTGETHEGFAGPIFYSKAKLRPIQLIGKKDRKLSEPQTIPPYFSECRHATKEDVELIYHPTAKSATIGSITGVEPFYVQLDFEKLVEKPFAIYGRTGVGKSILNKLLCCAILAKKAGSVLIFDMHGEYGVYSNTDNTEGLKYYFPHDVEVFSLDSENMEARQFILEPEFIEPDDLVVALNNLSDQMVDMIYQIDRERGQKDLITAIRTLDSANLDESKMHPATAQALQRRLSRISRLPFIRKGGGKDAFGQLMAVIKQGKSIVLDFGEFGTDATVYLFLANVLARRLFEQYTEMNEQYPRLIVFLEEAHRFLAPAVSSYTIFSKLARETRKFNLILAIVDQRPSQIDQEVRSQVANRLVMSLKEPSDVESALAGVPDRAMWQNIISTIPPRTVAVIGDAIRIPTVIDVMPYKDIEVREHILGTGAWTVDKEKELASKADDVFGKGSEQPQPLGKPK